VQRCLASHPDVSGFADTGVSEDEGQHLQSVYTPDFRLGGAGRFAFQQGAHLTEHSPLATSENRERLLREWGPHWRPGAAVGVEKSPPNLVRSRFLQALFPEAVFVMVLRHPIAVACATRKGRRRLLSRQDVVRHWVECHSIMAADALHLRRLHLVRYERLVRDPDAELGPVFGAAGVDPRPVSGLVRPGLDEEYFAEWRGLRNPLARWDRWRTVSRFDAAVGRFGYDLADVRGC
jgi:hypothetical protein